MLLPTITNLMLLYAFIQVWTTVYNLATRSQVDDTFEFAILLSLMYTAYLGETVLAMFFFGAALAVLVGELYTVIRKPVRKGRLKLETSIICLVAAGVVYPFSPSSPVYAGVGSLAVIFAEHFAAVFRLKHDNLALYRAVVFYGILLSVPVFV